MGSKGFIKLVTQQAFNVICVSRYLVEPKYNNHCITIITDRFYKTSLGKMCLSHTSDQDDDVM